MAIAQESPDPYEGALADLRRRRDAISGLIAAIEAIRDQPVPSLAAAPGEVDVGAPTTVAPGEFLGMTISVAAIKLLARERRALGNAEIQSALSEGGLRMESADPVNTVGSVLSRRFNTVGDVVRVRRGEWGLKEWYPNRSFASGRAGHSPNDAL